MKNILQIGRYTKIIKTLANMGLNDEYRFYIIEEPDILKKMEPFNSPLIEQIAESKYHNSDEYMEVVKAWSKEIRFDAVLAGFEYCVKPANKAAKYLNLLRIGDKGAEAFTNKINLRNLCESAQIPHPRYKKINSLEELSRFFKGNPIIFKPANRQASIGVIKITDAEEIEHAYNETVSSTEAVLVPDREIFYDFIAEDFIEGYEVSVECLVKDKKVIFINYTNKDKFSSRYFVEAGHFVPGELTEPVKDKLKLYKNRLVEAAEVENGVLHSEWIVSNGIPMLVECAARIPGDSISELITTAYGFNFRKAFLDIMVNNDTHINNQNNTIAAVQFFSAKPGRLKEIKNMNILQNNRKQIVDWHIGVNIGDYIREFKNSWDRIGYFIVQADSYNELHETIRSIHDGVVFVIE